MSKKRLLAKWRLLSIVVFAVGSLVLVSCSRPNSAMVKQLSDLQSPSGSSSGLNKQSIQQLQKEVARYQDEVNRVFESTQKLGRFYQMLALKYFNNEMYGPALRSFKEAINFYPTNPVLSYMAGLCQAQLAKAEANPTQQRKTYEEAATYYKNALSIDGSYKDALFGLSVLYVFELDRASEAEPYLKRLVSLDSKDMNALFLLARVYTTEGHPEEAAGIYDKIIASDASAAQKSKAEQNKSTVLERAFGK